MDQSVSSVDVAIPGGELMIVGFADGAPTAARSYRRYGRPQSHLSCGLHAGTFVLWDLDNEKVLKVVKGSKRGAPHEHPVVVAHFLPEVHTPQPAGDI